MVEEHRSRLSFLQSKKDEHADTMIGVGEGSTEESDGCVICLDAFDQPVITACGHMFCRECMMEHLSGKTDCPQCREPLTVDDLLPVRSDVSALNDIRDTYGAKISKLVEMIKLQLGRQSGDSPFTSLIINNVYRTRYDGLYNRLYRGCVGARSTRVVSEFDPAVG